MKDDIVLDIYKLHLQLYNVLHFFPPVPTPNVIVTVLNNQLMGDPLLLECNVTTVRGITSSVDITWITNDEEVRRVSNALGKTGGNSTVYTDHYNIARSLLRNNTIYYCQVIINSKQLVSAEAFYRIGKQSNEKNIANMNRNYISLAIVIDSHHS